MTTETAFRRLQAANPVPRAVPADPGALFEQIVATAPDPRLVRAPRRVGRPAFVLAVVIVLAAVLASTAPALSNWIGDIIGEEEVASEYTEATKRLTLPPGYEWPRSLRYPENSVTSRGAGGSSAVLIAQAAWECHWARAIEDGNVAAQTRSRNALANLLANHVVVAPEGVSENWSAPRPDDRPVAVYADDGGYEHKRRMYAAAAAGDATLIEQSCRANGLPGWTR